MANVLNRTTGEFRGSVNTPDFDPADWIINPDLTAVAGFPPRYWTITGDTVTLKNIAERAAVDAAIIAAQRDAIADEIDLTQSYTKAFALAVLDEFNNVSDKINEILDAIDAATNLNDLKTRIGAIADRPQRTAAQLKTAVRNKLDL